MEFIVGCSARQQESKARTIHTIKKPLACSCITRGHLLIDRKEGNPSHEGLTFNRSELEGGLQKSTEVIEGLGGRTVKVVGNEAKWTAEVVKRWSHRDVVRNLELVPPLPCIVTIANVLALGVWIIRLEIN